LDETIAGLKYDSAGLIPAIIVDAQTKDVLMMAWMNAQSLTTTIQTGKTHFWSRSRKSYWMKGESSGHTQEVRAMYLDCDLDTLVIEVVQHGAACHEGYRSCFFRKLTGDGELQIVAPRLQDPKEIYKNKK
jgi:phosphoribosyl-AMP cyclohydrolase